ncbi:MAG TPA: redox-regulated molecular chaperone Hsp33 [Halieaceae bacterium]|jgi:molecular chaperone Hsp33|uniref:Hsp33 family molecular chaperone HslO n=1 Tax=Haliea TaxID=475794 RepID=UPI0004114566|nr:MULTISPECIES: Hsp33 family molecular chaperone HslO [Haliea]HBQ42251.1 redox-regulated molecular chaperone Hsp33 [Halieaceae bacterium]MAD64226.1 redox-regulated molecular chaperone Hsp33 [Haliea sp.]MAY94884.1 redox-regulated molecular chaperone Hsp33 [Haliea sp.]MBK39857.1 redox-regulated molecular chaperone Hsp33 [Haliea sp.]MBP69084.1 redox-regulated molecular chaperone Hsp33 [Haliea sp.]|tara:strand:+ start:9397 stop:10293 length:897 start_codon:yes stop_codon:yes gene_type:complete
MNDTPDTPQTDADQSQRFLFDDADIRGEIVQLDHTLADLLAVHQYAPGVSRLLGEFLAAATLLSTTLKFEGRLVLQARSEGEVPLLMAECSDQLLVRGIARGAQHATSGEFSQLLAGGVLAITIEPLRGKPYQGIVPLSENSLAASLDAYFEQSEQLQTRLWLASDGQHAAGLLLQQLPAQLQRSADQRALQWQHASTLAATLSGDELLQLAPETLLHRLYHEDPVRLFEPRAVRFHCSCSLQRSRNALAALPPRELEEILAEQGHVEVDCEFCNQQYRFDREGLQDLLQAGPSGTVH